MSDKDNKKDHNENFDINHVQIVEMMSEDITNSARSSRECEVTAGNQRSASKKRRKKSRNSESADSSSLSLENNVDHQTQNNLYQNITLQSLVSQMEELKKHYPNYKWTKKFKE
ncbi:unnamed protein product [Ceratitis capitata]|uniref:(Mediterranean fruit fly) hypothetical protein n=1 Tax=Ceratitis capitata TaxID=7213 RepID=A0A811V9L1_CERCA|nr:unnamed protein product [Ceratitis capitata]